MTWIFAWSRSYRVCSRVSKYCYFLEWTPSSRIELHFHLNDCYHQWENRRLIFPANLSILWLQHVSPFDTIQHVWQTRMRIALYNFRKCLRFKCHRLFELKIFSHKDDENGFAIWKQLLSFKTIVTTNIKQCVFINANFPTIQFDSIQSCGFDFWLVFFF